MTFARNPWILFVAQALVMVLGVVVSILVVLVGDASPPGVLAGLGAVAVVALGAVVALEHVKARRVTAALAVGREADPGRHAERVRELTESRRTIVDAFEIERARIERDLHDGAQQYLVAASLKVGEAALALDAVSAAHPNDKAVAAASGLLAQAQDDTEAALAALRETVAGVHSRLLAEQGLEPAVRELAVRFERAGSRVVVRVPHPLPDLPPGVASAAWFFAAEALTNAAKHAPGAAVSLLLAADAELHVTVVDEGGGGAAFMPGRGLVGMRERLGAFGGELILSSPPGGPTAVSARMPLLLRAGEPGVGREPA